MGEQIETVELHTRTLGELFNLESNKQWGTLTIPDYQRAYEWNSYHVKNLLSDTFEASLRDIDYLMGTIIVHQNDTKLDIVDGQQRLITLSILLNAFNNENDSPLLNAEFDNVKSFYFIKNTQQEIQLFLHSKDNIKITEYLKFIRDKLKFNILIIKNGSLDLAYTFFDSLNSKGKSLSDFDLLKAHHLMFIPEENESLARIHNDFWQEYDSFHPELFSSILRRIRMWNRGLDRDVIASRNDFYEFISTVEPSEFEQNEHVFNRYMQPNIFKSWHRENDSVVLNMKYGNNDWESTLPFEIPQTLEGGDSFFLYAKRYHLLYKLLFHSKVENRPSALQFVYDLATAIDNDKLSMAFKAIMLLYYDKFGENRIIEVASCTELMISELRFEWGGTRPSPIRIESALSMVKSKNIILNLLNSTIASHIEKILLDGIIVKKRDVTNPKIENGKESPTLSMYKSRVVNFYQINKSKIKNPRIIEKLDIVYFDCEKKELLMNTINTKPYTPSTIEDIRFRIPLYQRPYAWEEKQIDQLLLDLKTSFDTNPKAPYYIGILSVGSSYSGNSVYDLLDGQQRITTLILIGLCLKEYESRWGNFLNKRLDFYGRDEDKIFIENNDCTPKTNPKMVKGRSQIEAFIKDKVNDKETFAKYVYENASFFVSEVPEGYTVIDKNLQFVRMNNRGKQLEATDILKIKLASTITSSTARANFIRSWDIISQLGCKSNNVDQKTEVESIVANTRTLNDILQKNSTEIKQPKETEIFYQSIVTFTELLLITLAKFSPNTGISFSNENKRDRLLDYFGFGLKDQIIWDEPKVFEFMQCLNRYFNYLDTFIIKRDKDEKYKLKNSSEFNSNDNSLQKLIVFQSYMYVSREPQNWLPQVFEYLSKYTINELSKDDLTKFSVIENKEFKLEDVKTQHYFNILKSIDDYGRILPEIDDMRYNNSIERYWFWRLDYYLWENWAEANNKEVDNAVRQFVFRANRSIEHLHPQSKPENWEDDMHSFGNLAMISSSFNSTQSDDDENVKFARIENQIAGKTTLESIKLVKMYISSKTDNSGWTKEKAIAHGIEMYDILKDSYTTL